MNSVCLFSFAIIFGAHIYVKPTYDFFSFLIFPCLFIFVLFAQAMLYYDISKNVSC